MGSTGVAISDRTPICTICGNEMVRLKRLGMRKHTPIFACGIGETRKPPCDGGSARLGSRFL
jgi:hypothetical protein